VSERTGAPWTGEEDRALIGLLDRYPYEVVARKMGRTQKAVANRLAIMGHGVRQGRVSTCAAAKATGWHWSSIRRAAIALGVGISIQGARGRRVLLTPEEYTRCSEWLAEQPPYRYAKTPEQRARIGRGVAKFRKRESKARTKYAVGQRLGCGVLRQFGLVGRRYVWTMECRVTGKVRHVIEWDMDRGKRLYCHPCAAKRHYEQRKRTA
jgi:integrase